MQLLRIDGADAIVNLDHLVAARWRTDGSGRRVLLLTLDRPVPQEWGGHGSADRTLTLAFP